MPNLATATYTLQWTLEIYKTSDYCQQDDFKPYGELRVDVGKQKNNQNVKLWEVTRSKHLNIPYRQKKVIQSTHSFQGIYEEFIKNGGMVTLHGQVMEGDDVIGDYEGKTFTLAELTKGQSFESNDMYYQSQITGSNSYVKITMRVK